MKTKNFFFFKKLFTALIALFIMSCSNDLLTGIESLDIFEHLSNEADLKGKDTELFAELSDNPVVSQEEATCIAAKFLGSQTKRKLDTEKFSNKAITDSKDGNNPLMYALNCAEGGYVIVSASRNYYPILAYSEENSFELKENVGGLKVWLNETEVAIKNSNLLDDKKKSSIRSMWKCFEVAEEEDHDINIMLRRYDPGTEMASRMNYLRNQYAGQGWYTFLQLSNAQSYFGSYPALWSSLCSVANAYGSPTNYTIVGLKYDLVGVHSQVGPFLSTQWNQGYPFNYLNNGNALGCAVVAMAQLMRFHQWPTNFNWSGMPNSYTGSNASAIINSDLPSLMQNIRNALGMTNGQTTISITDVKNTLQNTYGYIVTQANHNLYDVRNEILNNNRPLYMRGDDGVAGHAWVCDGVQTTYTHISYFVEYMVNYRYNDYTYSIPAGLPTPANPGVAQNASGTNEYTYFHMNWGWGGTMNDWFLNNDIYLPNTPGQYNFVLNRANLYIRR